tara:strand:- start:852 stop:1247 length:396 start_codon:yes stop_codon:yes gene_type:complete
MSETKYKTATVWDLTYALTDEDGNYKRDSDGKIEVFDYIGEDCSELAEDAVPEDLERRDDHWDYTYEPNTEIGIVLAKEDIDKNRKTPLTDKQWKKCVGLINRGKIDLGCVYDVLEEYCQSIVEEYCETNE